MNDWPERVRTDASLRAFVDAEIARAHVELESLRVEVTHWRNVAAEKQRDLDELLREFKSKKKTASRMTDQPSERVAG